MGVCIVVNDDNPQKETHICWCVEQREDDLILHEIVEKCYLHPSSSSILVPVIQKMFVKKVKVTNPEHHFLYLLKSSEEVVTYIQQKEPSETIIE